MKRSFPLHLALMTLLALSQVANAEDCPANAPAVYCTVKQYEDAFEVPRPVGDIFVGTFNAGTGGFNGLRSSATSGTPRARFPEPGEGDGHRRTSHRAPVTLAESLR